MSVHARSLESAVSFYVALNGGVRMHLNVSGETASASSAVLCVRTTELDCLELSCSCVRGLQGFLKDFSSPPPAFPCFQEWILAGCADSLYDNFISRTGSDKHLPLLHCCSGPSGTSTKCGRLEIRGTATPP